MRSLILTLGRDDLAQAGGALAAADLERPGDGGRLLRKGQVIGPDELALLAELAASAPGTTLSLLLLEDGDVDEGEAARLLGAALAGPGVTVGKPGQGRVRLTAAHSGLLLVDSARLAAANAVPEVAVYTLFGGTPVAAGTALAEAKISLLAAARAHVEEAARILAGAGTKPALEVRPFQPRHAALLVRERLAPDAAERMIGGLRKKLAWFGTSLDEADVVRMAANGPVARAAVASELARLLAGGADLLFTAGGSTSDPADPTLNALADLDATIARKGVPIHPGSLLWVAQRGPVLIVGVPSCGAFSEQTSLDVLLPRLLALGTAGLGGIEQLAEGGLLARGMDHRFPPYGKLD